MRYAYVDYDDGVFHLKLNRIEIPCTRRYMSYKFDIKVEPFADGVRIVLSYSKDKSLAVQHEKWIVYKPNEQDEIKIGLLGGLDFFMKTEEQIKMFVDKIPDTVKSIYNDIDDTLEAFVSELNTLEQQYQKVKKIQVYIDKLEYVPLKPMVPYRLLNKISKDIGNFLESTKDDIDIITDFSTKDRLDIHNLFLELQEIKNNIDLQF